MMDTEQETEKEGLGVEALPPPSPPPGPRCLRLINLCHMLYTHIVYLIARIAVYIVKPCIL